MNKKIAIIGAGNIGSSFIKGAVKSNNFNSQKLIVADKLNKEPSFFEKNKIRFTSNNKEAVEFADIIIIGVKPKDTPSLLNEIQPLLHKEKHTLVSLVSGMSIAETQKYIPFIPIVRIMPNLAMEHNQSVTALCTNEQYAEHSKPVKTLFELVGSVSKIEEKQLLAFTLLSSCSLAFVYRFLHSMAKSGVEMGLYAKDSYEIVNQAFLGASELMKHSNSHPEEEIDRVCTPGGLTIQALNEMERQGFSESILGALTDIFEKNTSPK